LTQSSESVLSDFALLDEAVKARTSFCGGIRMLRSCNESSCPSYLRAMEAGWRQRGRAESSEARVPRVGRWKGALTIGIIGIKSKTIRGCLSHY
jgi:hypothetical protein